MKKKILTLILPATAMVMASCGEKPACQHVDEKEPWHYCDLCNEKISDHYDNDDDGKCDLCGVVYKQAVIESISVDPSSLILEVGEKGQVSASVVAKYGASSAVAWKSSDSSIVNVDSEGKVSALAKGTAIITATSVQDASKSATCTITVKEPGQPDPVITSVIVNPSELNVAKGGSAQLYVNVQGQYDFSKAVTWSSKNTNIASVSSSGEVIGIAEGTVKIRATSVQDTSKFGEATITVVKEVDPTSKFAELRQNVNTNHNYTVSISTHLDNDPTTEYDYVDFQKNINDKALFMNGESVGFTNYGLINLKDKGYIWFGSTNSGVVGYTPYSTWSEKGVHELYDLNLENLINSSFARDTSDPSKYTTTDEMALNIMYAYSGYSYSWASDDGIVEMYVDEANDKLTFKYGFSLYYYDEETLDETIEHAVATVVAEGINSTSDNVIESFIENPDIIYPIKTEWSDTEQLVYTNYFKGLVPSFIPNATWTFDLSYEEKYDGIHLYASDIDCGDQREAYGALLVENDGFTRVNDNKYTKVVDDEEKGKTTTWTVNMVYKSPEDPMSSGVPYGDYYKNGYFEVEYFAKEATIKIDTIAKLNDYMTKNGYNEFAPLFPTDSNCTGVSNFSDKTSNADYWAFYTGTAAFDLKFTDSAKAKAYAESYISLLESAGYEYTGTGFGGVIYTLKNTPNESHVNVSDPSQVTDTVSFSFTLYKEDFADPVLSSIELSGYSTQYDVNDEFSFDGKVIANYTTKASEEIKSGYVVSEPDMSIAGEKTITVSYTEDGVTKSASYKIEVGVGKRKLTLGVMQNVSVSRINGSLNTGNLSLEVGSTVTVQISIGSKYQITSFTVTDSKGNVTVPTLVQGETKIYEFTMPSNDAVISIIAEEAAPVATYSINVDPTIENGSIKNILVDGASGSTAKVGQSVRFTVSANENYSIVADSVKVTDGSGNPLSINLDPMSQSSYIFTMPSSNVTITAEFEADSPTPEPTKYAINKDNVDGLKIKIAGMISEAEEGDIVRFTLELDDGYELLDVFIKDHPEIDIEKVVNPTTFDETYQFEMPAHDVTISGEVLEPAPAKAWHVQADSSMEHGSIAFAESYYDTDEKVEFTVTPDSGYEIDAVSSNPSVTITSEGDGKYSFDMPSSDVVVSATFKEQTSPEPEKFSGTFVNLTGEYTLILQFNEDGTGSYTYSTSSVTFTYTKDGNTLNITYASGNKDNFGNKALFINSDEAIATINTNGNVEAKIGNIFSSSNKTFTKQ